MVLAGSRIMGAGTRGLRNFAKILGWNLGLLFVVAAITELVFGGWLEAFDRPGLWRLSIYRDVDWSLSAVEKYGRVEPVHYRRDEYGLRGGPADPKDIDILALGGSTTDERFVSEGETWTDRLENCLKTSVGAVEVANAGVAGQSARGHLANFEHWFPHIPDLAPKLVLVYLGVNENALAGRASEDDVRHYNESGLPLWLERAKLKSALYSLYGALRGNLRAWRAGIHSASDRAEEGVTMAAAMDGAWAERRANALEIGAREHDAAIAEISLAREPEMQTYADRLRHLSARIRDMGALPVFITQAGGGYRMIDNMVVGDLEQYLGLQTVNQTTLAICGELGISCLNLAGSVRFGDGDFYDSVHTTPSGSAKVAAMVCTSLINLGVVPSKEAAR